MKAKHKVKAIVKWCDEFHAYAKEDLSIVSALEYFFKNLPPVKGPNPLHRIKEYSEGCEFIRERFTKTKFHSLYNIEWDIVKTISYGSFFIEHVPMLDIKYKVEYKMLGNGIIFTDFYVPKDLIINPVIENFYLKK